MKKIANPEIIEKTVREHGITGEYEVNVFIATEEEMRKILDGEYHDVLSFPLELDRTYPDGVTRLGDIVICDQEKDVEFLAGHGCLHLLGIHHD
ncbi:MAG: rRNA maturation RNAse YbeY [Patescibacteria group bacterium]